MQMQHDTSYTVRRERCQKPNSSTYYPENPRHAQLLRGRGGPMRNTPGPWAPQNPTCSARGAAQKKTILGEDV
eukprot:scaffold1054_cov116-Isochrysis_galbana.AAC.16